MAPSSPHDPAIRPPHPLAVRAIERLASGGRVLDFGTGSGRNSVALRSAGFDVEHYDDVAASDAPPNRERDAFAAIIATHALLHGTRESIARRLAWLSTALARDGLLYATLGCVDDARFGVGRRIDRHTFAPTNGDEAGVAHSYFSQDEVRVLLSPRFTIESLEAVRADAVAGRWAHPTTPLRGAVHWFIVARRRDDR
jgi:hypothetical protein